MTAPPEVPEVLLCGKVLVRKARSVGWVVGEPYDYVDVDGNPYKQLLRPSYYFSADDAMASALTRLEGKATLEASISLLGAIKTPTALLSVSGLTHPGPLVRSRRIECRMTQNQLAQHSGLSARHIRRIEAGGVDPCASTLAALHAALCPGDGT